MLLGIGLWVFHSSTSHEGSAPPRFPLPDPPRSTRTVEKSPLWMEERQKAPDELRPTPSTRGRPQVALIMDDLGNGYAPFRAVLEMNVPMTLSVLPRRPQSGKMAQEAVSRGMEVMLHLPMEPWGYPDKHPGLGALMFAMSHQEVEQVLLEDLRDLPEAKGVNNHMGSRFTEDRDRMGQVMDLLAPRGLYFVDSLTSPSSLGFQLARDRGVRAYRRDLFLDAIQDEDRIRAQFGRLMQIARVQGHAIGICHPYPETLRVLPELVADSRARGFEWATISQLRASGE